MSCHAMSSQSSSLHRVLTLFCRLVHLRFFAELASITCQLLELPPVEESRAKAERLKRKLTELAVGQKQHHAAALAMG